MEVLATMATFADIKNVERDELDAARKQPRIDPPPPRIGLAFSGGGIRSATFNLGFLQGLATAKLLSRIDYLSTVSGGGYIGGWLVSWIKRAPGGLKEVESQLGDYENHRQTGGPLAEPSEVNFLRDYSNYLTPRKGIFGGDTWAAIATYLRNVLLNQAVLILLLASIMCLPWLLGKVVEYGSELSLWWLGVPFVAIALFAVWWASGQAQATSLIGVQHKSTANQKWVLLLMSIPLFFSSLLLTMGLWKGVRWSWVEWALGGAIIYALGHALGVVERWRVLKNAKKPGKRCTGPSGGLSEAEKKMVADRLGIARALFIPGFALIAGAAGGLLVHLVGLLFKFWHSGVTAGSGVWHAVSWGPPIFVTILLLTAALHIGLLRFLIPSQEHEWWARSGGLLLLTASGWAALFGLSVFVPLAVKVYSGWTKTELGLLAGWLLSSGAGIWLGRSPKTSGRTGDDSRLSAVATVTPYIFIAGLMALLSLGIHGLAVSSSGVSGAAGTSQSEAQSHAATPGEVSLEWQATDSTKRSETATVKLKIENPPSPRIMREKALQFWNQASQLHWLWVAFVAVILFVLSLLLSYRVDINNFSMNPLYRNRLVRCYLGASRDDRQRKCSANPFTGFDPADDTFLADFLSEKGYLGPYPLICAALNVTHGERLAWQERKAESFVFTPKYCGFDYPEMHAAEKTHGGSSKEESYRETDQYGYPKSASDPSHEKMGGVRLGTAISISGAAASPNMGYHTSPPLAFLMTIFNVRLGWWLANPRYGPEKFKIERGRPRGGPPFSLFYLLCELFAATTDRSKYVYLSDGGHFENLGIYELVRRRCKYIIASDADADDGMKFEDLGNAIRKCRSDFGVEIEINPNPVQLRTQKGFAKAHGVTGHIHYPRLSDEEPKFTGELLYVKPTITENVPRDILAYRAEHPVFPNQTTADQWFDESQFESYRRLGLYSFEWLTGTTDPGAERRPLTIPDLFALVK